MSLVGNLEDLGLGDILQIVSLSRKSGVLSLQNKERDGKIVFLNGHVIRATSSLFRENLGDLLLRRRLVDIETLKKALYLQRTSEPAPRIGDILAERFGLNRDTLDDIVREQVEKIVYSFFGWTEGTFSFELGEPADLATTSMNPLQFMLDQGLNPQWLAMEGSRIVDEKRHRGEALEIEGEEPLLDVGLLASQDLLAESDAAAVPATGRPAVFLIDDDVITRERLGRTLLERGLAVKLFEHPGDLLQGLESAAQVSPRPVVIIDLIMPRADGSGVFGGLDLLQTVRRKFPDLMTIVLSDYPNPEMERKVRKLGVPAVIPKPKKNEIREERAIKALEGLGDTLLELLPQGGGKEERLPDSAMFNLGAELLREIGETAAVSEPGRVEESPGLHLLRGMLQELSNPSLGGGIILLVLRFASEFMNRAVIFLVKEREIVGLGQFGINMAEEMADVRVRRMKIPIDAPSIFSRVLHEMTPLKIRMGVEEWDDYLRDQLGGKEPLEIFLGPVVSEGKTVALLYGDNLPEYKAIGNTEALEIFLSQAGLAMEKALLERRLRGKDASEGGVRTG